MFIRARFVASWGVKLKVCVVIPVYNHWLVLRELLASIEHHGVDCFLVDDGSNAECAAEIQHLGESFDWVFTDRLAVNAGKGAAVLRGLALAQEKDYSHALQIDADGQHDLGDIDRFFALARRYPHNLILGMASYDDSVPVSRYYGRFVTHFWVWVNTLSLQVKDSMCGFRVYPIAETLEVCKHASVGLRMEFDIEVVVRMSWAGVKFTSLSTHVTYPQDGISHFDMFKDNVRISGTHAKLFFGMLIRLPLILFRRLWPGARKATG